MSPFGRRTFLASSAGVAAGAVAAGALSPGAPPAGAGGAVRTLGREGASAATAGSLRAGGLTVNGSVDPVGVDPDDCSFAWTLRAPGRQAVQTGYRIVVRRTDPGHGGVVWDSGTVQSARQAFVAYGGPALAGGAAYEWTVQPAARARGLGRCRPRPASRRRSATATGRASGCVPPPRRCRPTG